MYIHIYIYIYIHMYTHTHPHTHPPTQTYTYTYSLFSIWKEIKRINKEIKLSKKTVQSFFHRIKIFVVQEQESRVYR